ncbi:hypothetical protein IV203_020595 [Nitzschia inconspicua]|uniref:Uncharacterized protein n=1 Tax=Nitzschia inconspicua TaxID=303405 RepID=A0A9K3KG24_9STRA|nr:hypothetical protein IV203_020595 [Nitzschia inconspicua]
MPATSRVIDSQQTGQSPGVEVIDYIKQTSHQCFNSKLLYPYKSQTNALSLDLMYPLVQYLTYTGRNNCISILYEVDGRTTGALNEALSRTLRGSDMLANQQDFINRDKEGIRGIFCEDNTI